MPEKETELRSTHDLAIGDKMLVGGLLCAVTQLEDIFHYVPDAAKRVSLTIVGTEGRKVKNTLTLFLPTGTVITILK